MKEVILANYHTHTARCRHADGTEVDYIETALRAGFDILGFSDHAPWNYRTPGFVSTCRMLPSQLPDYVETLRGLRTRYEGRIKLFIGLEAEYFPAYMDELADEVNRYALDYLILGNHFDDSDEDGLYFGGCKYAYQVERYVEKTLAGMETGMYRCLAHPDVFLNSYPCFDNTAEDACRTLCKEAVRLDMPLEYNMLGADRRLAGDCSGLGYTTNEFWSIAREYPVKAILGCDAHTPSRLDQTARIHMLKQRLRAAGITVLDTLPGLE